MNARIYAGATAVLLLLPDLHAADEVQPAQPPSRPEQIDREKLREEFRNLSPEERRARMEQWRERFGQPDGQPFQRPMPQGMNPAFGGGSATAVGRAMMILNPEQRESLRGAMQADQEKIRELEQQLREARKAAADAGIGKDFKEEDLRAKLEAAAKLDTEITVLRAKALAQVQPPLTDDQIQKLKNPPPMGDRMRERRPEGFQPRPPGDSQPRPPREDGNRPPNGPF
jgi:Spy/CpxP family protein refolding chaperone